MTDVKTPAIEEIIGLSLERDNVRASLRHLEEAFRADLGLRDNVIRRLQLQVETLEQKVAALQSARVEIETAPLEGDLPDDAEPNRPGDPAGRGPA